MNRSRRAAAGIVSLTALLAALVGAAAPRPQAPAKPQRIMSTNLCSDLLLLMLVPRERIASVTYLAHGAVRVLMPGADAGIATNHGAAEEVVRDRPDLILASAWSTPVLRRLAAKVGAPVAEIDSANSFADVRRITRQVGALVGEPARAEALVARMDRRLAELAATRPAKPLRVVAWSAGDVLPGKGTLTDDIIRVAGAENTGASYDGAATLGIEELLAVRPDAILRGEDRYDAPALRDAVAEHPVLRRAFRGRQIAYPASLYTCGLPQSADAAFALRQALAKMPPGGVAW